MKIASLTDEQLVKKYVSDNDNEAIGILYQRYFNKIYYKCLSYTQNKEDAFDFAQEIILKTILNIHTYKGESKFSTWLFAVSHNYIISQLEKADRIAFDELDRVNHLQDYSSTEQESEYLDSLEYIDGNLDRMLNEIPENDRELLILKYRKNYTIKDIQQAFGLSGSAVKMRLLRARQKVEEIYQAVSIAG